MTKTARKLLRRYDAGMITQSVIVDAWESHIINATEFGKIIGEAC